MLFYETSHDWKRIQTATALRLIGAASNHAMASLTEGRILNSTEGQEITLTLAHALKALFDVPIEWELDHPRQSTAILLLREAAENFAMVFDADIAVLRRLLASPESQSESRV